MPACFLMFQDRAAKCVAQPIKKRDSSNGRLKTIVRTVVLTMSTAFSTTPAFCPDGKGSILTPVVSWLGRAGRLLL